MKNKYLIAVKNKILNRLLLLSCIAFAGTVVINILNQRPMINTLAPLLGSVVIFTLYYLHSKQRFINLIRYTYIIFSCLIYYPFGFLTSPGTYSAMAFYSVVFFFISTILVYHTWEYIFPFLTFLISLALFIFEGQHPETYHLYTTPSSRAFDLSVNFFVVAFVISLTVHILNHYFQNEHERIFDVSMTDPLTGIYNRRYLYQMFDQNNSINTRTPITFTLLMMDLNNFKAINDRYGHTEGDAVLKSFSDALVASCRKNDIPIRYGGDEFILILIGANLNEAKQVEHRIEEIFYETCKKYVDVALSVSFGYAESNKGHFDEIIKKADDLLYKNKSKVKTQKNHQ